MHRATRTNTTDLRIARTTRQKSLLYVIAGALFFWFLTMGFSGPVKKAEAQAGPSMTDPNLLVGALITNLTTPIGIAFPAPNQYFFIEKNTGKVMYLANGSLTTVLDLAVNNASERGLLGIALDPHFSSNHFVYLYWTAQAPAPPPENPFFPTEPTGSDAPSTRSRYRQYSRGAVAWQSRRPVHLERSRAYVGSQPYPSALFSKRWSACASQSGR